MCILSDAEREQKRDYAKRYPKSDAFGGGDEQSVEEALLEFKLGSMIDECTKAAHERKGSYVAAAAAAGSRARGDVRRRLLTRTTRAAAERLIGGMWGLRVSLCVRVCSMHGWRCRAPSRPNRRPISGWSASCSWRMRSAHRCRSRW